MVQNNFIKIIEEILAVIYAVPNFSLHCSKGPFIGSIVIFESSSTVIFLTPMVTAVCSPSNEASLLACRGEHMFLYLSLIMRHSLIEFRMIMPMLAFWFLVDRAPSKFIFTKSFFGGIHLLSSFFSISWVLVRTSKSFISLHALDNNKFIFHGFPLNIMSFLYFQIVQQ